MIKDLIKKRFARSLKTYDKYAVVQKQMAKKLAEKVDFNPEYVLELGCGTGLLTNELVNKISYGRYDAVDIVDCKEYIFKISENINFICGDIEDFSVDGKADLVISNAVLQWIEDLPEFIKKTENNLTDGGYFIFTLFGKENYRELNPIIKSSVRYYSVSELQKMFEDFEILYLSEEKIVLDFDSPKEVLHHIKNTGVNAITPVRWTKSDLAKFEADYSKICGNKITLTYNPIYIVLKKK